VVPLIIVWFVLSGSFMVIAHNPVEIYCFFRAWVSFFAYALKYNLRLVVISKLGNIDGSTFHVMYTMQLAVRQDV